MYRYVQNRVLMYLKLLIAVTDVLFLNLALGISLFLAVYFGVVGVQVFDYATLFPLLVTYNMAIGISCLGSKIYSDERIEYLEKVFRSTLEMCLSVIFIFSGTVLLISSFDGALYFLSILAGAILFYAVLSRFLLAYVYNVLPKRLGWAKDVYVIGHNDYLGNVMASFPVKHPFYTINTIPYYDREDSLDTKDDKVRQFKRYFEEVSKRGVHEVFLVNSPDVSAYTQDIIEQANFQCVALNFVSAGTADMGSYNNKSQESMLFDLPVLRSHKNSLNEMDSRFKKRVLDTLISGFVILFILSWMVPIIGLIIKIQSPGPIFFKQPRSGRNNQTFDCLKFRSMVVNKDSNAKQASKGDKRITPIGQFLRKTSLDEFPQFINVFLGQMSIVGPRPHMLAHTEHYSKLIQHYMVRHYVKPGITGWAQVNGYRGETNEPGLMAKRVEYDLEYMNNWSVGVDLKIICMTALNMAKGEKNAY